MKEDIKELIKKYEDRIQSLKELINEVKKPHNVASNPNYARLQTKINCHKYFVTELTKLIS